MSGAIRLALLISVVLLCWFIGTDSIRAAGGTSSELQAQRQLVQVLRGEHQRASYRRCRDEITTYSWPDARRIPPDRVRAIQRTWENRLNMVRSSSAPRAVCWRSHLWAESWAGRCISSREGGLRSVSPGGTYHGKWQADLQFQRAYGAWFYSRWGVASNWPEYAQDVMGYRGWQARGWHPWPSTASRCGLL